MDDQLKAKALGTVRRTGAYAAVPGKKKRSPTADCIVNDVAMTAIGKRCDAGLMMGTRQPIHRDSAIKLL